MNKNSKEVLLDWNYQHPKGIHFSNGFEVNFDFVILAQRLIFVVSLWESSRVDFCTVRSLMILYLINAEHELFCLDWFTYIWISAKFYSILWPLENASSSEILWHWMYLKLSGDSLEVITQSSILAFKWGNLLVDYLLYFSWYYWWLGALKNSPDWIFSQKTWQSKL